MVASRHPSDILERCASDLHSVAFDYREPARSVHAAERRIAEVERIIAVARAAVRGRPEYLNRGA